MSFGRLVFCKSSQHHNNYFRQCFAQAKVGAKGSFTYATFVAKTHSAATVAILVFSLPSKNHYHLLHVAIVLTTQASVMLSVS